MAFLVKKMKDFSRYYYKNKLYNNIVNNHNNMNNNENIYMYDIFQEMYKFVHDFFTKYKTMITFGNLLNFDDEFNRKEEIIILKCLKTFFGLQCKTFNINPEDDNRLLENDFNYDEIENIMPGIVLNIQEEDNNPPE